MLLAVDAVINLSCSEMFECSVATLLSSCKVRALEAVTTSAWAAARSSFRPVTLVVSLPIAKLMSLLEATWRLMLPPVEVILPF